MDLDGGDVTERVARLEGQVESLLAVVDAQAAEIRALRSIEVPPPSAAPPGTEVASPAGGIGRRRLLVGGATATAVAAAAVVGTATPVAAANGEGVILGVTTNSATATTGITTADAGGNPGLSVEHTGTGAAVLGLALSAASTGLRGASAAGSGVLGTSLSGAGVRGESESSVGVRGVSETDAGVSGTSDSGVGVSGGSPGAVGVFGASETGTGVQGISEDGDGVIGGSDTGIGVVGGSASGDGVMGTSESNTGVRGESGQGYGMVASSPFAQMRLVPGGRGSPLADALNHFPGEVVVDSTRSFWVCVTGGTPGSWRKLAGTGTSGALHLLATPARVYDSRAGTSPSQGPKTPLPAGNVARTIDLKVNSSTVPAGARGALVTVLLVNAASGNGNFTIWANDRAKPQANTLVWGGSAGRFTTLAVTSLDAQARVKVDASLQTNVVLDVVGYYL